MSSGNIKLAKMLLERMKVGKCCWELSRSTDVVGEYGREMLSEDVLGFFSVCYLNKYDWTVLCFNKECFGETGDTKEEFETHFRY